LERLEEGQQGIGGSEAAVLGSVLGAVTPWTISTDLALAPADSVPIADAGFTFMLPSRSVTTFVGGP